MGNKKDNHIHSKHGTKKLKKVAKELPIFQKYIFLFDNYLNDIECTIDMFRTVIPVLEEQDNSRKSIIKNTKNKLKTIKPEDVKDNLEKKRDIFITLKELFNAINKLNIGKTIFKNNIIISLISRYDEFVGDILKILLTLKPDAVFNQDKTLTLTEIYDLGSIERILDKFIEKEVEKVLRDSHSKQFDYLEKRVEIPLRKDLSIWPDFIELTQRRNLLAHCGGIISAQYLKVCKDNNVDMDKFDNKTKEGSRIIIDNKYIESAFFIVYEIGFKLGQTIYRKTFPEKDKLEFADSSLTETGYQHLYRNNWAQARMIFDYATKLRNDWVSSDGYKKVFIINLCIALINLNRKDEAIGILNNIDWSSANSKFTLAVSVLNDNFVQAEKIMSIMNGYEPISEDDFREWPLFNDFRKTEYFARAFKKIYGKDYDGLPSQKELKLN